MRKSFVLELHEESFVHSMSASAFHEKAGRCQVI